MAFGIRLAPPPIPIKPSCFIKQKGIFAPESLNNSATGQWIPRWPRRPAAAAAGHGQVAGRPV